MSLLNRISQHISDGRGQSIACYCQGEALTYQALADAVVERQGQLQPQAAARQLCALALQANVANLITYLACLAANIPLLLLDSEQAPALTQKLLRQYQVAWWLDRVEPGANADNALVLKDVALPIASALAAPIRADLALLMSTSGSTGSPKCVMLSQANLVSNAESICQYLPITAAHCAITSLPLHYSYGLSVLNSHLWCGGAIVLTQEPLMSREFWRLMQVHQVNSLAGVPFSYQMLKTLRIERMSLPSLQYLTQAGGKLPAALVAHFTQVAATAGWELYLMYGQTEATARMAYLPPALLACHADCIGQAIPGGRLWLEDEQGQEITAANVMGELHYQGANVMLGYALDGNDLLGDQYCSQLATGDLALMTADGLFKIVGRKSRFLKIRGKRFGLDHIDSQLQQISAGAIAVTGQDELLIIAHEHASDAELITDYCHQLGLHPSLFACRHLPSLPRLSNGKLDYPRIRAEGLA
ncbi:AMP-binding protein [Shewanella sp. NIFS-20-20]|uniref:AMP-binding protein n=1 Tax=Shewanella sp. NIFS-20-20 TaxID=2853806 RepID=UPI001C4420D9|nr:AMP-binding protein [Shewanella sp. NIFS-20-20]MBV7316386.1 AMP-binding protein [Shewanella sp. NIFS-20-20]